MMCRRCAPKDSLLASVALTAPAFQNIGLVDVHRDESAPASPMIVSAPSPPTMVSANAVR